MAEEKKEPLTEAEINWARKWVLGIASVLAKGPPDEPPEVTEKEIETIKNIALEEGAAVYDFARTWRKKMIEVFAPKEEKK